MAETNDNTIIKVPRDGFATFAFEGTGEPFRVDTGYASFRIDALVEEHGGNGLDFFRGVRDLVSEFGGPAPDDVSVLMAEAFVHEVRKAMDAWKKKVESERGPFEPASTASTS